MSAFVYNAAVVMLSTYILAPFIILSVVGAAWLFGRASGRIGLLRASRPRETEGGRDGEGARTTRQIDE